MSLEQFIAILIIAHASLGGIALTSGLIALIAKKGSKPHVMSGKIFFWSMLSSGLIALAVAAMPGHYSVFLFVVGVFSTYLISIGYRSLRYKKAAAGDKLYFEKFISIMMMQFGIAMIAIPVWQAVKTGSFNVVMPVFGAMGIVFSIRDFMLYAKPEKRKASWLRMHLSNMTGGYIAALTAFVVVNQWLPGIVGWLGPTVVGTVYITFWNIKVKKQMSKG